jgi:hypothetical protein
MPLQTVGLFVLSGRCSFSKSSIARVLVLSLVFKKKRRSAGFTDESGRQTTMGQPHRDSVEKQSIELSKTYVYPLSN